ncbi:hypothetical protein [Geodermatophilus sp. URMC 63]
MPDPAPSSHVALGDSISTDAVAVIGELNGALRRVAVRHGAAVADVAGVFLGHGLRAGDPARRDARPPDRRLWSCDLVEPNAWGAGGVRTAFWDALVRPGPGGRPGSR